MSETEERIVKQVIRLKAENARLRDALEGVLPYLRHSMDPPKMVNAVMLDAETQLKKAARKAAAYDRAIEKARAALAGEEAASE